MIFSVFARPHTTAGDRHCVLLLSCDSVECMPCGCSQQGPVLIGTTCRQTCHSWLQRSAHCDCTAQFVLRMNTNRAYALQPQIYSQWPLKLDRLNTERQSWLMQFSTVRNICTVCGRCAIAEFPRYGTLLCTVCGPCTFDELLSGDANLARLELHACVHVNVRM